MMHSTAEPIEKDASPETCYKSNVDHPSHYNFGKIETIDYIEDVLGKDGGYSFCIGNVIKYVSRAGKKNDTIEDLSKAAWYLNRAIELKRVEKRDEKILPDNAHS